MTIHLKISLDHITSLLSTVERLSIMLGMIQKILIKLNLILFLPSSLKSYIFHCSGIIGLLVSLGTQPNFPLSILAFVVPSVPEAGHLIGGRILSCLREVFTETPGKMPLTTQSKRVCPASL